jgi:diaminopimelate decarboxylase
MLTYKKGELVCEGVPIPTIVRELGTPVYVYSQEILLKNFRRIKNAFAPLNPLIAYSVKANSNLSILSLLARDGSGFDIVSGGELHRVLAAGGKPDKIIYAGVGKTADELRLAVKSKILMVNLESEAEANLLSRVAQEMKAKVRVSIRINPDVEAHTHEYITTGKKENKFGISYKSAPEIISRIARLPHIEFVGLHVHVGSQILNQTPHISGARRLVTLINNLRSLGIEIRTVNIGGGYGIGYKEREKPMNVEKLAKKIIPLLRKIGCRTILEPGRFIVASAGALITSVTYVKVGDEKRFAIVDAGMNDLIRPSLYKAYHRIIPVKEYQGKRRMEMDVVGPICESADFFGKERKLPSLEAGDLLAICDAGAYGFVMASNYNTRLRPAEVLVRGREFFVVKKRESYKDLLAGEQYPPYLR